MDSKAVFAGRTDHWSGLLECSNSGEILCWAGKSGCHPHDKDTASGCIRLKITSLLVTAWCDCMCVVCCAMLCCVQELGALMLKAGKASEAAKHLQQALDLKVSNAGLCQGLSGGAISHLVLAQSFA